MKRLIMYSAIATALSLTASTHAMADTTSYKKFYVTYMSTDAVAAAVTYAKSQGINHIFMWTVDQDAPISSQYSLINAINKADPDAAISTYYANYAVYNNQRPFQDSLIKLKIIRP